MSEREEGDGREGGREDMEGGRASAARTDRHCSVLSPLETVRVEGASRPPEDGRKKADGQGKRSCSQPSQVYSKSLKVRWQCPYCHVK